MNSYFVSDTFLLAVDTSNLSPSFNPNAPTIVLCGIYEFPDVAHPDKTVIQTANRTRILFFIMEIL